MSKFMDQAIELALKNVEEGGTPYGAVVVKDGEVIGEGTNTMHKHPDISGHAELMAIKEAQSHLGRIDLSDCVVYASGHPCPMCFGAITLSGIPEVYYSNTYEDATEAGMPLTENIYKYLSGNKDSINLSIKRIPIKDDDHNPMLTWINKHKNNT